MAIIYPVYRNKQIKKRINLILIPLLKKFKKVINVLDRVLVNHQD